MTWQQTVKLGRALSTGPGITSIDVELPDGVASSDVPRDLLVVGRNGKHPGHISGFFGGTFTITLESPVPDDGGAFPFTEEVELRATPTPR